MTKYRIMKNMERYVSKRTAFYYASKPKTTLYPSYHWLVERVIESANRLAGLGINGYTGKYYSN